LVIFIFLAKAFLVFNLGMGLIGNNYYVVTSGKFFDFLLDFIRDGNAFYKFQKIVFGQISAGFFSSSKHYFNFDFMAFPEKFFRLVFFKYKIVVIGSHADSDTFHIGFFLLGFILPFFFGFLILVFPKIHDLANRRISLGRYFNQVKNFFFGDAYGFRNGQNTQLFSIFVDDSGGISQNTFVDSCFWLLFYKKFSEIGSSNCFGN